MTATLADDKYKYKFMKGNVLISKKKITDVVFKGPTNNIPALVQLITWRRVGLNELLSCIYTFQNNYRINVFVTTIGTERASVYKNTLT